MFKPSKQEYIHFLFDFNAQVIDKCYPYSRLYDHIDEFRVLVKNQIQNDIERASHNYYKRNRPFNLWVPPRHRMKGLVNDYIKFVVKKLK